MSVLRLRAFTRCRSHDTCFQSLWLPLINHGQAPLSSSGAPVCQPKVASVRHLIPWSLHNPQHHHRHQHTRSLKLYPKVRCKREFLDSAPRTRTDLVDGVSGRLQDVFCVSVGVLRRILDSMCGEGSVVRSLSEVIRSVQDIDPDDSQFRVTGVGILLLVEAVRSVMEGGTWWGERLCAFWSRMEALKAETLRCFYFCACGVLVGEKVVYMCC